MGTSSPGAEELINASYTNSGGIVYFTSDIAVILAKAEEGKTINILY